MADQKPKRPKAAALERDTDLMPARDDEATAAAVLAAAVAPDDELPSFSDDDTKPVTLIERTHDAPDHPATRRDLLWLWHQVATIKRTRRTTEATSGTAFKDLETRVSKVEFPVRILWALFVLAASGSVTALIFSVSLLRTEAADGATKEYRLKAAETALTTTEATLQGVLTRLRDTEESARVNALQVEGLQHRAGSNPKRNP